MPTPTTAIISEMSLLNRSYGKTYFLYWPLSAFHLLKFAVRFKSKQLWQKKKLNSHHVQYTAIRSTP